MLRLKFLPYLTGFSMHGPSNSWKFGSLELFHLVSLEGGKSVGSSFPTQYIEMVKLEVQYCTNS